MKKLKEFYESSPEVINLILFLLFGALLVVFTNSLFMVFAPFIIAYLVTRLLYPLRKQLSKIKIPSVLGTLICMVIFGTITSLIAWVFGHYLVEGITYLIDTLSSPETINKVITFVQNFGAQISEKFAFAEMEIDMNGLTSIITDFAKTAITWLSDVSIAIATQVPNVLMSFIIGCVASFYMLYDYERLADKIDNQLSDKTRKFLHVVNHQVLSSFLKMILSYIIISAICFTELAIGFNVLGVENATFIALIIALLDVLPILGSGAVLAPWGIVSMIFGDMILGVGLFVLWGVITVVRQIVEPKIVGKTIGLHPLLTLGSLFIGLKLMGGLGLIVGPLYVIACKRLNESGVIKLYKSSQAESATENKKTDWKSKIPFIKPKKKP